MHYDGPIYRPPVEAYTPLLQVTVGCSHNKCAFCNMYKSVQFRMSKEEEIIEDLEELSFYKDRIKRVFLVNGDPFCLKTEKLLRIAELIHQYLPKVETISGYCSIRNDLSHKSLEELKALRAAGYDQLHIGIETAYEPALKLINKGYTIEMAEKVLENVLAAGFQYHALLMCGIAGKGMSEVSTTATARLLNKYRPYLVSLLSTVVTEGTPLADIRDRGEYIELTERELILEEIMLLEKLEMDEDCLFFGSHVFNKIPVTDYFSHKAEIIAYLKYHMAQLPDRELDTIWRRDTSRS